MGESRRDRANIPADLPDDGLKVLNSCGWADLNRHGWDCAGLLSAEFIREELFG